MCVCVCLPSLAPCRRFSVCAAVSFASIFWQHLKEEIRVPFRGPFQSIRQSWRKNKNKKNCETEIRSPLFVSISFNVRPHRTTNFRVNQRPLPHPSVASAYVQCLCSPPATRVCWLKCVELYKLNREGGAGASPPKTKTTKSESI